MDERDGNPGKDHLPASEAGTGIIPEDHGNADDVRLPESEADSGLTESEEKSEPQSWPGRGFGSIPPPG